MWNHFENYENGDITINRQSSFYVGDAAGRLPTNVCSFFQNNHIAYRAMLERGYHRKFCQRLNVVGKNAVTQITKKLPLSALTTHMWRF